MYQGYRLAGGYEIIDILGSGGMATVYRGRDQGLNRDVAIKVIGAHLANDTDYMQRFTREAETIARLQHPNIIQIYNSGWDQFGSYVVMPLLQGGTLQQRMRQATNLISIHEVGALARQVGSALHYAHSKGIIHRDIKFSNIMFDMVGTAYVMDFGIAKLLDATQLTGTSSPIGTPQFMPPEQWRGSNVTEAVDQYALAIVLYKLITGHPPFEGSTSEALMYQHLESTPPRAESYRPEIPASMGTVFERALNKKPEGRFPTMEDFAVAMYKASLDAPAQQTEFFTFPLKLDQPRSIPSTGTQSRHTPASYPPPSSYPQAQSGTYPQNPPQKSTSGVLITIVLMVLFSVVVGIFLMVNAPDNNLSLTQTAVVLGSTSNANTQSAFERQATQSAEATEGIIIAQGVQDDEQEVANQTMTAEVANQVETMNQTAQAISLTQTAISMRATEGEQDTINQNATSVRATSQALNATLTAVVVESTALQQNALNADATDNAFAVEATTDALERLLDGMTETAEFMTENAPTDTATPRPTTRPSSTPRATQTPRVTEIPNCPGIDTQLIPGETARVLPGGAGGNRIREQASTGSTQIGRIPEQGVFGVIDGPECNQGYAWWEVEYNGIIGWTAEGDSTEYYVEPLGQSFEASADDLLLLRNGTGQSNGRRVTNGEFQVEYYCSQYGYGSDIVYDNSNWWCERNGSRSHTLTQTDFNQICRDTYNVSSAVALQNGTNSVPAFRWLCYE